MKTITFDETQWKLVPIEPTERMVVAGFESEPDKCFTPTVDWDQYEAMTGCQQAAHRAKLCWSAMLEAAPTPSADGQPDTQAIRDAALEEAAALIDSNQETVISTADDDVHSVTPRKANNMAGLAYANAIRALKSQPVPGAQDLEEKPSLFNPLTPYGLLIRALRIVVGTSLMEMSEATGYTPAYLSSVEFGREKLTFAMISAVRRFFGDKGLDFPGELLWQAARAAKERT